MTLCAWWARIVAALMRVVTEKHRLNDIPNITFEKARVLDPDLPAYAWGIIARFTPWSIAARQWLQVRHLVAEVVVRMRPRTPDTARHMCTSLAGFVAWSWAALDVELSVEAIFTAGNAAQYMQCERMSQASTHRRRDVSRLLSRMGRDLAGVEISRTASPLPKFSGRLLTAAQMGDLYGWAISLTTETRRRNACALLSLGAGAGLTAKELAAVRIEHLRREGDLILVDVPCRRPRTVPLLASWKKVLLTAIGDRTEGLLFVGYRWEEYPPRSIQSFITENPAPTRPSMRDLRRSWVVAQIEGGTPWPVIKVIGGFASEGAIGAYVGYVKKTPNTADYFEAAARVGSTR